MKNFTIVWSANWKRLGQHETITEPRPHIAPTTDVAEKFMNSLQKEKLKPVFGGFIEPISEITLNDKPVLAFRFTELAPEDYQKAINVAENALLLFPFIAKLHNALSIIHNADDADQHARWIKETCELLKKHGSTHYVINETLS